MKALLWNKEKHQYQHYDLPNGASAYEDYMNKKVTCASCGKKIIYGQSYTSRVIHTHMGFGYAVCKDCYIKEEK